MLLTLGEREERLDLLAGERASVLEGRDVLPGIPLDLERLSEEDYTA